MPDLWYSIAKDNPPLPLGRPFRFFLTASGDGLGANNHNGNYTVPTDFFYISTSRFDIHSIVIMVSDAASFGQTDYGAIASGLLNGVTFWVNIPGTGDVRLLTPDPIKFNYDWYTVTEHASITTFSGSAQTLVISFEIMNDFGIPLTLFTGWKFIVRLNDNFTGLLRHTFHLRGTKY